MQQATAQARNRRHWRAAGIGLALLCVLLAVALHNGETASGAEGDGCTPTCVILIQVDGLEPKDVTQETTPYLWLLAHPNAQGQNIPGGALNQRSGWIWQAPRAVMSTGVAPATASLLTGGYPETTSVPSDDFYGPNDNNTFTHQRLTAGGFGDTPHPESGPDAAEPISSPQVDTLIAAVRNTGGETAVFLGDPGLARLTEADSQADLKWYPPGDANSATNEEGQYTGNPHLCPLPRYPEGGAQLPGQEPAETNFNPSHCPANDMTTLNKAVSDLKRPEAAGVGFTFIHLAELGAAKRLVADTDADDTAVDPDPTTSPPQVPQVLSNLDQAIATFVEQYAQGVPKWDRTVLMVVGTHGYQTTPLVDRVPDPVLAANATRDVSDFVAEYEDRGVEKGSLRLVPQGTTATIYYGLDGKGDPANRADALAAIKDELETRVRTGCADRNPALTELTGPCIRNVFYVDKDAAGSDSTVAGQRKSWHLDARTLAGERTRASGDLIVELARGWAFGRAVGLPFQLGLTGAPWTNPHTASSGGPQERAMAALINGPSQGGLPGAVRNLDDYASSQLGLSEVKYYPVAQGEVNPSDPDPAPPKDPLCPDTLTDPGGLACANHPDRVVDDAENPGHKAQPETVDFALTISALMQLPFETPTQLQGRVLQEAFLNKLEPPCIDCDEAEVIEPDPPPPPPLPEPPVEVVQPEGFNFHGLVRDLEALVVDAKDKSWAKARRGSRLSTIRLEGDFGKPETAVTLTFYRPATARRRAARKTRVLRLKAIARFDPFAVKRGHVTMRLKIPRLFKPTHLGLTVREIALNSAGRRMRAGGQPCTTLKTRKPVPFRCTGPARGVILRIADAGRLHKRKGRARSR